MALGGTGLQPAAITALPASLDFARQQPGVASTPLGVTITNSGGTDLANIGLQMIGPGAANYNIVAKTCAGTLASGSSCTAQITFTPPATGNVAATLVITSSTTGGTAVQVPLNGSGQLSTGLAASPGLLPFTAAVGVGQSSSSQSVAITNSSSYPIPSLTLTATGPFTLAQNTCTGSLAPGAACTAAVVFQPAVPGALTGTLTASSPVVTTPATVPLSGTGFDFAVTPSGPSSATVSSGQQANYKLVIAPNGAAANFSFQCGSLPAHALCQFSPATEQLGVGVQGNVEVEIFTGSSTAARLEAPSTRMEWPLYCVLMLAPFALWRGRRALLLVVLAACLAVGITSCAGSSGGGGGGGQSSSSTTPPGTYSIPVLLTSTGVSHTITLTMTVD